MIITKELEISITHVNKDGYMCSHSVSNSKPSYIHTLRCNKLPSHTHIEDISIQAA